MDELRAALQKFLDSFGDGWHVESFVILFGLEKLEDGVVHRDSWVWTPPEQAHYVSRGLVDDGWSTIVTNADE